MISQKNNVCIALLYVSYVAYYVIPVVASVATLVAYVAATVIPINVFSDNKAFSGKHVLAALFFTNGFLLIWFLASRIAFGGFSLSIVTLLISINALTALAFSKNTVTLPDALLSICEYTVAGVLAFYVTVLNDISLFNHSENHLSFLVMTLIVARLVFNDQPFSSGKLIIFSGLLITTGSFSNAVVAAILVLAALLRAIHKTSPILRLVVIALALVIGALLLRSLHAYMVVIFGTEIFLELAWGSLVKRVDLYYELLMRNGWSGLVFGGYYDPSLKEKTGLSIHNSFLAIHNTLGLPALIGLVALLYRTVKCCRPWNAFSVVLVVGFLMRVAIDTLIFTHLIFATLVLVAVTKNYRERLA